MAGCIRTSRFLVAILVACLVWVESMGTRVEADSDTGPIPSAGRPTYVTSRGGPRPISSTVPGRDTLVASPQLPLPPPTPTALPLSPPPSTRVVVPEPTVEPKLRVRPLGVFRVTAYSDSIRNGTDGRGITRSGVRTHWGVVAVDPTVISLGSRLLIDGMGDIVFTAWDTGGGVLGRWVDVWYQSDGAALEHGVQYREIYQLLE